MNKTDKDYKDILKDFDESVLKVIQDKCLYAVIDVAYEHGYAEGFLAAYDAAQKEREKDARAEVEEETKKDAGLDSASSDYAALMGKFLDAVDDTEHGNRPLADCMGDLFDYFKKNPLEDNQ